MRKQTGFALVAGSVVAGVLAASFFLSGGPTPVVEPTLMPFPAFTPTPTPSTLNAGTLNAGILGDMHGDYAELATQYQQALAQAMTIVGELLATPQLADVAWQTQVAEAMAEVEKAYALLLRLQPNDEWQPFHEELIAGAAECNAAMRVLDLALDEEDRSAVLVVGSLLGRCQSHLTAAGQLVSAGKPINQQ